MHKSDTGAGAACAAGSTTTPRVRVYTQGGQRSCVCRCTLCVHVQRTQVCAHSPPTLQHSARVYRCVCTHTSAWLQEGTGADAGVPGRSGACQDGAWVYAGGTHGLCVGKSIRPCLGRMRVHAQASVCGLGACVHRHAGVYAGDVCAREVSARAREVLVHRRCLLVHGRCLLVHGRWLCTGGVCLCMGGVRAQEMVVRRGCSCTGDVCAHASVPA